MLAPADLRFVGFGLLACFTSSLGQTYFIAIFGGAFRETFGLSHGQFGTLYSVATLASGLLILWLGGLIDRVPLRLFAVGVAGGLAGACALVAAAPSAGILGVGLFGLRLCGQGLMVHLALTSMARYFDRTRGRMIALALMGLPLAEATLPRVMVELLHNLPWRSLWFGAALLVVLVVLPVLQAGLIGHGRRHAGWLAMQAASEGDRHGSLGVSRASLFRDRRFQLLLPALVSPAFIATWIFFHQVPLAAARGWPLSVFATSLAAYAAASVAATLVSGFLIDRFGSMRLLPIYLLPLCLACAVLAFADGWVACPVALALLGLTTGASGTVMTSVWAEIYGVAALGTVRAVATSLGIVASAASPGLIGVLIDLRIPFAALLLASMGWALTARLRCRPGDERRRRTGQGRLTWCLGGTRMTEKSELDLDRFRRLLEARRTEVEAESRMGEEEREPVELDQQSQGRLSRMDAIGRQAVALDMERRRQAELQRIDHALTRIEEGEFGWCAACGEPIAPKRLELDPAVATCIGCASQA